MTALYTYIEGIEGEKKELLLIKLGEPAGNRRKYCHSTHAVHQLFSRRIDTLFSAMNGRTQEHFAASWIPLFGLIVYIILYYNSLKYAPLF